MKKKVYLTLGNGKVLEGYRFGAEGDVTGELVFTTGMVGYDKTLTDPAYYGQIVVQTFPLIGNYGIIESELEAGKACVSAYVVREVCDAPSNFRTESTLDEYMKREGIVGIYGVDTRELTRIIRDAGVMNACISSEPASAEAIASYSITNAVEAVTVKNSSVYNENASTSVAFVDYGAKESAVQFWSNSGVKVVCLPATATAEEILSLNTDGIILSEGPGNPAEDTERIAQVAKLLDSKKPVFGIGLGHQLVALAKGAKVEKHKYGHRGGNQPVKDANSSRIYITSQNHGYIVLADTLAENVAKVSYYNVNDNTCEGLVYEDMPVFTVQFYPATSGGPLNTMFLFDQFTALMDKEGK